MLVSRTDDATLRVLRCALCVLLVCVLVLVLVCHRDPLPPLSPCVPSKRPLRVHIQNVPVCTGTTPASVTTCGTHGDVLNVHTGVFSVPHHTTRAHTTTTTTHTRHNNKHHNNTWRERQRMSDKTRQDERFFVHLRWRLELEC